MPECIWTQLLNLKVGDGLLYLTPILYGVILGTVHTAQTC